MQFITIVAAIIFAVAIVNQNITKKDHKIDVDQKLTPTTKTLNTISPTLTPAPTQDPKTTVKPTDELQEFIEPTSTQVSNNNTNLDNWIYPGSNVKSKSQNNLILTNPDDTDQITSWYEEKIRGTGVNIKSFIKTRTNETIQNKLIGSGNNIKIELTIAKNPNDNFTLVDLSIQTY